MKDMSKGEWMKEARFLYLHLKELHSELSEYGIVAIDMHLTSTPEQIKEAKENLWKVYCIEKNIKPEDYEI